jgi:hypothetical protein
VSALRFFVKKNRKYLVCGFKRCYNKVFKCLNDKKTNKRGELIMPQGLLPFKYEEEKKEKNFTGLCGLLLYLELFKALRIDVIIQRHLRIKEDKQGWRDDQVILALLLLNLAGGESVSDIEYLERDEGFCRILKMLELRNAFGRRRKMIQHRWRKVMNNTVASPSSIFRYLSYFHNASEDKKRGKGKSFVPACNEHLEKFPSINYELLCFSQDKEPHNTATLDIDATFTESHKSSALECYKGYKSYQGLNVWWFEQELVLNSEFRDGNVEPAFEVLRVLIESLVQLPEGVENVYIRLDSAGYQHNLMKYCDEGCDARFGRIGFAIGCDVFKSFKEAILLDKDLEWHPIHKVVRGEVVKSGQQWAEVCFVPNKLSRKKEGLEYRYIAVREELKQKSLPGMEDCLKLPFPTIELNQKSYKLTAIVTNLDWYGELIVLWYRERCGKSEEAHSIMKEDLAGGRFPSSSFGENAAWWWVMILSLNINSMMRRFVLGKKCNKWKSRRMKGIRFHIINIPGRVVKRSDEYIVRVAHGHPSFELFLYARQRIMELAYSCSYPCGPP